MLTPPSVTATTTANATPGSALTIAAQPVKGTVTFYFDSPRQRLGSATAVDHLYPNHTVKIPVATLSTVIPRTATPGRHLVLAIGHNLDGRAITLRTTVTVNAAASTSMATRPTLPRTGSPVSTAGTWGALLLLLGACTQLPPARRALRTGRQTRQR